MSCAALAEVKPSHVRPFPYTALVLKRAAAVISLGTLCH